MGRVQNKVALVTGGASQPGLGSATAIRLAEEGARVIVTDVDEKGAEAVAAKIRAAGGQARALRQDVASDTEWAGIIENIRKTEARLDILVNNAGIAVLRTIDAMTNADWMRQLDVNLNSVFYGTKRAIESMRNTGGGSIINLSSVAAIVGVPACGAYSAAKAGLVGFTKSIALETARENIRVNAIHPGMIATNMMNVSQSDNAEEHAHLTSGIPMGKLGDPIDIANGILFLASDEAKYVTGASLVIDGGMTIA